MKKDKFILTALMIAGALTLTAAAAGVTWAAENTVNAEKESSAVVQREENMWKPARKILPRERLSASEGVENVRAENTAAAEQKAAVKPDFEKDLEALASQADKLVLQADKVADREGYRNFKRMEWDFEAAEETLERKLEQAFRAGELTRQEYSGLERRLDQIEERADDLDDRIEFRLGWDDDRDDDWDDDWDD